MSQYYIPKDFKTPKEQIEKNKEDIEVLNKKIPDTSNLVSKDELNELGRTITADTDSKLNNIKNTVSEEIGRLWEIVTLTKVINYNEWVENTYTIENEIFNSNNHIIVSPSPDNGTNIVDNVKSFGLCGVQAQEITEDGKLTLKATMNAPESTLYVQFLIMKPASINFESGVI